MVRFDHDLMLALVKYHRDAIPCNIYDLACFSAIFTFCDSDHIARLKVFGYKCDVNLLGLKFREVDGFEGDEASLNLDNSASHAGVFTSVH